MFFLATKGQGDFKMGLNYNQIPELMLNDDSHFIRVAFFKPVGDIDIILIGIERDEKMVSPGNPVS